MQLPAGVAATGAVVLRSAGLMLSDANLGMKALKRPLVLDNCWLADAMQIASLSGTANSTIVADQVQHRTRSWPQQMCNNRVGRTCSQVDVVS